MSKAKKPKSKRKRALRHKLRNPIAKDLRSPKYRKRVESKSKRSVKEREMEEFEWEFELYV